jgi:hypothetical protein
LKELIGLRRQRHVVRVRPNQDRPVFENQIDRILPMGLLRLVAQRRLADGGSLLVQIVKVGPPLRAVDAGQRDERIAFGKNGANPRFQLPVGTFAEGRIAQDRHGRHFVSLGLD